jgi:hypothetical protein
MKGLALAVAALALVSACAPERGAPTPDTPSPLIGRTRAELLACAGAPNRTARDGDAELLIYTAMGSRTVSGEMTRFGERKLQEEVYHCEATFAIRNDRVAGVTYRGTTSSVPARNEACAAIVARCR